MVTDEVLAGAVDLWFAANEGGEEAVIQVEPENPASAAVAQRAAFTPGKQVHSKDGTQFNWDIRELHVTKSCVP
ncbi:hypothetical protein [Streptomyces sp. NPDC057257]|uniref:hypothetical protein n=1 Tax=Streptomyces sp. NPDC057257 TaxID=3346071 RepID=UPI003625C240